MPTSEGACVLQVDAIEVFYADVRALSDVSLHVSKGEIVTLIGANGAGKSTTLRAISGLLRPRRGQITYDGVSLATIPPSAMIRKGVAHIPEGRRLFPQMTVFENLIVGLSGSPLWKERGDLVAEVLTLFPGLKERRSQLAGSLSGGEQQMVAIGRGLICQPQMLILDEPSLGLAPVIVERIFEVLQKVNRQGMTILLVEQNARLALELASRGYVVENGRTTMEGTGAELLANDYVTKAFLGL